MQSDQENCDNHGYYEFESDVTMSLAEEGEEHSHNKREFSEV